MVQKVSTKQMEKKLQQLFFQEVTSMLLDITAPIIPFWRNFAELGIRTNIAK